MMSHINGGNMKLNKNQTKFFISAINHFGLASDDVRLKDLTEFAEENDLIVPTSALKRYCQDDDLVRGHYNLLLTGISPSEPEVEYEPTPLKQFSNREEVIIDSSSYAEPAPIVKRKKVSHYEIEKGQKPLIFRNPVYVVSNNESDVIAVHKTVKGAFNKRYQALHDDGLMDYSDFEVRLQYVGGAIIPSSNSQLTCTVEVKEVEE
jgi:hypothetical protein